MLGRCLACGICGTDLHTMKYGKEGTWVQGLSAPRVGRDPSQVFNSQQPCVLGHEFVCEIASTHPECDMTTPVRRIARRPSCAALCPPPSARRPPPAALHHPPRFAASLPPPLHSPPPPLSPSARG